jgi:hypothetical protein
MAFPFPNVSKHCPLCGEVKCARWKGYFVRNWMCGELGCAGAIAIHVGHCVRGKKDFSCIPDFLVPRHKLSRLSLKKFVQVFIQTGNIKTSIDDLVSKIPLDDFTVALSSAYEWVYQTVRALRLNASRLAVTVGSATSVFALRVAAPSAITDLFRAELSWHPSHHMLLYPP